LGVTTSDAAFNGSRARIRTVNLGVDSLTPSPMVPPGPLPSFLELALALIRFATGSAVSNTVDIGTNVAYRLTGGGRITVFITQSLGFASAEWWPLQDQLSGHARVLTWNRPGYGESGPPVSPRTVSNIAAEGLQLLSRVAPDGPIVLVGHSQGGLYANAMARLVAGRVIAVVLLDPAHPNNSQLRRELSPKLLRGSGSDLSVPADGQDTGTAAGDRALEAVHAEAALLRDHVNLSPLAQVEEVAGSGRLIHLEQPELTLFRIVNAVDIRTGR